MRDNLLRSLEALLGIKPGVAVVHSSIPFLIKDIQYNKWDILYCFGKLVEKGWTFCFPSFTFSFCTTGLFDIQNTSSETGVLADWIYDKFPNSVRTNHPIYSFVVVGSKKSEFTDLEPETTFGTNSSFEKFEQLNASILMLGAGWKFCTQFHRYEEIAEVSYRKYKKFTGVQVENEVEHHVNANMFVRDLEIDAKNDFSPLEASLRKANKINSMPYGRGYIESTTVMNIKEHAQQMLSNEPFSFVSDPKIIAHRISQRQEKLRNSTFKVALLGSSNLDIAKNYLQNELYTYIPERDFNIYTVPFGQLHQVILDPGSDYNQGRWDFTIFADRLEDLAKTCFLSFVDPKDLIQIVADYSNLIAKCAESNRNTIVVHEFSILNSLTIIQNSSLSNLVDRSNKILREQLSTYENVCFISTEAEKEGISNAFDSRLWYMGKIPFSSEFTHKLVRRWVGICIAVLEKSVRLIVLDLDNTLWGGVIGEEGIEGIQLGGDFPGNAFKDFQSLIKSLANQGVALAVCSKNDQELALKAINNHKDMVIGEDLLVAHRINWKPKWQNISEIAQELDLGLSSILFIDDNNVERESVRQNLPAVRVLELPTDVTHYAQALLSCPWIEKTRVGDEDKKRLASYKMRSKIITEKASAANIDDFLKGLDLHIHFSSLNESNLARAAQLCQKTNQFNTTTIRYSANDLLDLQAQGARVVVIGLSDKYSDKENIGLIIIKADSAHSQAVFIDLFLLSCRVLGRTVEKISLQWVADRALSKGFTLIRGKILETERNTPVRSLFADNDFTKGKTEGIWEKKLNEEEFLSWFTIHDEINAEQDNGAIL